MQALIDSFLVGALTIPSSLSLIVHIFPEPSEQARALNVFGGAGAIGNILGLLIGAFFVQWASWRWVFWFVGIIAIPIAINCLFLIPQVSAKEVRQDRLKSLDLPGVSILTSGIVLFIFAVTSSSSSGWGSARVIAPLIISVFIVVAFLFWERAIPENRAAMCVFYFQHLPYSRADNILSPPRTWFYPNFGVLIGVALLPYLWWTSFFTVFTLLWQQVYGWTAISTAVHMSVLSVPDLRMSFAHQLYHY
jgi:MFS family permease